MIYTNINSSDYAKRAAIKARLDDFCTFQWNGVDAWEQFGAFVVSKDQLKFYNGASFSNEYTSPSFTDEAGTLTGLKFSRQQISFTMGVYWIGEEDYRYMMYWLNPYEIGSLVFSFEPYWAYNVKLTGRKDTTRYVLGNGEDDKPRYYTEMSLTFEVQGEPCAIRLTPYQWQQDESEVNGAYLFSMPSISQSDTGNIDSNLSTGFNTSFSFQLPTAGTIDSNESTFTLTAEYENTSVPLFSFTLQNIAQIDDNGQGVSFRYNSTDGLLFWTYGNSEEHLLTKLSAANGKRIIKTMQAHQFRMPGVFEYPDFNFLNLQLKLVVSNTNFVLKGWAVSDMRARTTLI